MAEDDGIDLEILAVFLNEASESLAELDSKFIALEANPKDRESVDAIFRAVHTVKGNAAFFGLMRVKRLAHTMEDLLALMRERRVQVTAPRVSKLLQGVDKLKAMLESVHQGESELSTVSREEVEELGLELEGLAADGNTEEAGFAAILNQLDVVLSAPGDLQVVRERLKVLRAEVAERHERAVSSRSGGLASVLVEEGGDSLEALVAVLGQAPGDEPTDDEAKQVEKLLGELFSSALEEEKESVTLLVAEHDRMVESVGFVPLLREVLLEGASKLLSQRESAVSEEDAGAKAKKRESAARTMRVEECKIDQFLDYVGDLIIVREMFVNVGKRVREVMDVPKLSSDYQNALEAFTLLSHNLQESIMEVRKVSIKGVLQKVPRMARDLGEARGKEVRVEIHGEHASVDKSLVESLEGPLTHMVRNAVDHGIESPELRAKAGKDPCGSLVVRAHEEREYIRIDLSDDGGGIDEERLKAKAIENGVITEYQANRMTREEAFELLFAPGLSTAAEVTDISGRGVGMDVVRRSVTDLGGDIHIKSEIGKGTTFSLLLPKSVTVQILDGFLVRVCGERFILPLQSIKESFRPDGDDLVTVADEGEYISRRGQVFPLLRFCEVLSLKGSKKRCLPEDAIVVSVDVSGQGAAGLLVDEVLGVQQVVLREVHGAEADGAPFAGGAVLGDGRVAMIVDVDRLGGLVHA